MVDVKLTSAHEFEAEAKRLVEREFKRALRALQAGEECEIPIIGGVWPPEQYRGDLQQRAIRALCAQKWCEDEIPRSWRLTLPLKMDDCTALFNGVHRGQRRARLVGE